MAFSPVGLAQTDATITIFEAANRTGDGGECFKGADLSTATFNGSNHANQTLKAAAADQSDGTALATVGNSAMSEPGNGNLNVLDISSNVTGFTVQGLAFHSTSGRTGNFTCVRSSGADDLTVVNCFMWWEQTDNVFLSGINTTSATVTGQVYIDNVGLFASGVNASANSFFIRCRTAASTYDEVSHNSCVDNSGTVAYGIWDNGDASTLSAEFNNIMAGFATADYETTAATVTAGDNNQSSDTSGTVGHQSITAVATFINPAADLRLLSTAVAIGAGTNRTGVTGLAEDNQGLTRTVPVDLGSMKFVAAPSTDAPRQRQRGRLRRTSYHGHHYRSAA